MLFYFLYFLEISFGGRWDKMAYIERGGGGRGGKGGLRGGEE